MDIKKTQSSQRARFLKLSLKKNRLKIDEENKKSNLSPDIIILDESFDKLSQEIPKQINHKIYSPIVINDSAEISNNEEYPEIFMTDKKPSQEGNVSFNVSQEDAVLSETKESRPSMGGCTPAQYMTRVTPKHIPTPSTPQDVANESLEECSIKKIQQSQKKLLSELYGDTWQSIPKLFKTISRKYNDLDGISKKLHFNDDDDNDKENVRRHLRENRELYLTGSDSKHKATTLTNTERKSKKKLYTELIPTTPEPPKPKVKNTRTADSTTKKLKGKTVTEMVNIMLQKDGDSVDSLTKRIENVSVTPLPNRLSFMASLADDVPSWRCHPEAIRYRDEFAALRERLTRRLFDEFNRVVFDGALDADLPIVWDTKLRSTAGTTTNRLIKNSRGDRVRTSSIKLSAKVVDAPRRLRDTLAHELCHAATWLLDGELRAGHGPLWKKWATRALRLLPELGEISRCHDMEIHFKYSYKCTKCGYSIQRHSKSIDVTKKCCGYCRGTFAVVVNKKNKDGVIVSTPARKGGANDFALYVKQHYGAVKRDGAKTHAQVMRTLGEQFAARKNEPTVQLDT